MRLLKFVALISLALGMLAGCSSAPVADDQSKILPSIKEANKVFPSETWLLVKTNYPDDKSVAMIIKQDGCGIVPDLNMYICYKNNALLFDGAYIHSSPLWSDGFTYHLSNGDLTVKQLPPIQAQNSIW